MIRTLFASIVSAVIFPMRSAEMLSRSFIVVGRGGNGEVTGILGAAKSFFNGGNKRRRHAV